MNLKCCISENLLRNFQISVYSPGKQMLLVCHGDLGLVY